MRPASQVLVALVVAVVQSGGVACGQEERPHPGGLSASQLAREGSGLSPEEAAELESHLETRPDDLATRARLLGYYFGSVREGSTSLRVSGSTTTIEARRRHILWIIRNHPEAEIAGISAATLDPQGDSLADDKGFEQARALWLEQTATYKDSTPVLGNAAKFLQLHDKELVEGILKRAQALEPENPEWSGRLGYLYALGILGVDGLTQNGLPTSFDPAEVGGEFARRARTELEGSSNPVISGRAGTILFQYGSMLQVIASRKLEPETWDLAERLLKKAQELEPNAGWSMLLEQLGQRLETSSPGLESVPSSSSASPKLGSSGGWVHRIAPPRDAFLAAQRAGAQGRVTVGVTIERDGTVSEVELIEPVHPVLDDAVLTAVRQWRHESVKIRTSTQVSFTLDRPRQARPSGSEAELKFSAGMRFFRADRTAEALEAFRGVLAIDPRHGLAHYMLGRALINTGDFLAAREHLERFLELAPDDPEVRVAREMLESLR